MLNNLICPISNARIDGNVVRTNGFMSASLLAAYVATRSPWIIVPVGIDYMFRARMRRSRFERARGRHDGPSAPRPAASRTGFGNRVPERLAVDRVARGADSEPP